MAISTDLRIRAVNAYQSGQGTRREVALRFMVSESSLRRWIILAEETGGFEPRPMSGRPPIISDEDLPNFECFVLENADETLQGLADIWEEKTSQKMTFVTVNNYLKKIDLTYKKNLSGRAKKHRSLSSQVS